MSNATTLGNAPTPANLNADLVRCQWSTAEGYLVTVRNSDGRPRLWGVERSAVTPKADRRQLLHVGERSVRELGARGILGRDAVADELLHDFIFDTLREDGGGRDPIEFD